MSEEIPFPILLKKTAWKFWLFQSLFFAAGVAFFLFTVHGAKTTSIWYFARIFSAVWISMTLLFIANDSVALVTILYDRNCFRIKPWLRKEKTILLAEVENMHCWFERGKYVRPYIIFNFKSGMAKTKTSISQDFERDDFQPIFTDLYNKGIDVFIH